MATTTGFENSGGADLNTLFKDLTSAPAANVGIETSEGAYSNTDLAAIFEPRDGTAPIANTGFETSEGAYSNQDLADIFMDINYVALSMLISPPGMVNDSTNPYNYTRTFSAGASGGSSSYTYLWSLSNNTGGFSLDSSTTGATIDVSCSQGSIGTYTATLTCVVTDTADSKTVQQNHNLTLEAS